MLLLRLKSILRILALASSAGLLGVATLAALGANLGAPDPAARQPLGLVISAATLAYVGLFWWTARRRASSLVANGIGGLLQVGAILLFAASVRGDGHAAGEFRCGLPSFGAAITATIGLGSTLAIAAMQAHGYLTRRWAASLPPAPPRP